MEETMRKTYTYLWIYAVRNTRMNLIKFILMLV